MENMDETNTKRGKVCSNEQANEHKVEKEK